MSESRLGAIVYKHTFPPAGRRLCQCMLFFNISVRCFSGQAAIGRGKIVLIVHEECVLWENWVEAGREWIHQTGRMRDCIRKWPVKKYGVRLSLWDKWNREYDAWFPEPCEDMRGIEAGCVQSSAEYFVPAKCGGCWYAGAPGYLKTGQRIVRYYGSKTSQINIVQKRTGKLCKWKVYKQRDMFL